MYIFLEERLFSTDVRRWKQLFPFRYIDHWTLKYEVSW